MKLENNMLNMAGIQKSFGTIMYDVDLPPYSQLPTTTHLTKSLELLKKTFFPVHAHACPEMAVGLKIWRGQCVLKQWFYVDISFPTNDSINV